MKSWKYLDSSLTNQNVIHKEIKYRLKQEIHIIIEYEHFCLLDFFSDNLKINIYNIITFTALKLGLFSNVKIGTQAKIISQDPKANTLTPRMKKMGRVQSFTMNFIVSTVYLL